MATNTTRTEVCSAGLARIVPTRRFARGYKPTVATAELNSRHDDNPSKFCTVKQDYTEEEVRLLFVKVVEIGVIMVIRNHVYKWKNQYYMQTRGVPTGLRLSGLIGRITMDSWMIQMSKRMLDNRMKDYLFEKYVDDSEIILENLETGSRWDEELKKITVSQEDAEDDISNNRTQEEITMNAWGSMASTIVPGLVFTVDHPANHSNGRVPVLDVELWREKVADPNNPGMTKEKIRYSYYEKEVANQKVMDRESAIPQECVRRLHNMSRDLPDVDKCEVLAAFIRKLQKSGYSQGLRREILQAGVTTYRNKIRAEVLGIRPFHRLKSHNISSRSRAKVSAREDWYKPNPGAWKNLLAKMDRDSCSKPQECTTGQDNTRPQRHRANRSAGGLRSKPSRNTGSGSNPGSNLARGQVPSCNPEDNTGLAGGQDPSCSPEDNTGLAGGQIPSCNPEDKTGLAGRVSRCKDAGSNSNPSYSQSRGQVPSCNPEDNTGLAGGQVPSCNPEDNTGLAGGQIPSCNPEDKTGLAGGVSQCRDTGTGSNPSSSQTGGQIPSCNPEDNTWLTGGQVPSCNPEDNTGLAGGQIPNCNPEDKTGLAGGESHSMTRTEGILFVPHTPDGLLAKMIQKEEDMFARVHRIPRIKVIERTGSRIVDTLSRKDPWAPHSCGRPLCMICNSSYVAKKDKHKAAACGRESVVYMMSCDKCAEADIKAHYYGESARTGFIHGKEHLHGQKKVAEENPLAKHDIIHHGGMPCSYSMRIVRKHKKALERQIHEATCIQSSKADILLNSKNEWNGPRVPRISVEVGAKVITEVYNGP